MSDSSPKSSTAFDPIRIALCITELDPGGAEKALYEIVTRLDRTRWLPRVYCLGPETELSRALNERGVETVCLGATRPTQVGVLFRLVRELRQFRPSVLQSFLFHANILGRIAGVLADVPLVYSGLRVAEKQKRWHLWLDRWTQLFVSMNVCVSEGVRLHAMQSGISAKKLCVIPNGVDEQRFANAIPADMSGFGIPGDAQIIVTVGRLTEQKGHADLIRAVAPRLVQRRHLVIVGEGEKRAELEAIIQEQNMSERVHLIGWQPDIPGILAASHLFVLPSLWEGMPNALLEAMASGLPCIATDVEGVRELLGTGDSAKIVAPGDVKALRNAVYEALENLPPPHKEVSHHISIKRFTWNSIVQKYGTLWLTMSVPE